MLSHITSSSILTDCNDLNTCVKHNASFWLLTYKDHIIDINLLCITQHR